MVFGAESALLAVGMGLAAILYAAVGHAGASGYLAVMALAGVAPAVMRPTALALNILVAVISTVKFYRVGAFSWRLLLPLAVTALPLAYLGGRLTLPTQYYRPLVGAVLLYAAWRTLQTAQQAATYPVQPPSGLCLVLVGGGLGFLSGLTGVGGGIFLSPLLLLLRWAPLKVISGVSAAFILLNSLAGIAGVLSTTPAQFHPALPMWGLAVVAGGYLGAEYGSRRLGNPTLQRLLALVLVIAGSKLILS